MSVEKPSANRPVRGPNGRFARKNGEPSKPVKNRKRPVKNEQPADPVTVQAAPNLGRPIIRPDAMFQTRVFAASGRHVYYQPDESYRNNREQSGAMERDLSIIGPLFERRDAVALLKWHIEPEDADDPAQESFAAELTRIIESTPKFLNYRQALLWGVFWGRSGVQNQFNYDFYKGRSFLRVTGWTPVHGDTLVYDIDGNLGVRIGYNDAGLKDLAAQFEITPEGRVCWLDRYQRQFYSVYQHWKEAGVYEDVHRAGAVMGVGVRDKVYYTWLMKNEILGYVLQNFSRLGSGFQVWTYTQGDTDQMQAVETAIKNQNQGHAIVLPVPADPNVRGPGVQHEEIPPGNLSYMLDTLKGFFDDKIRTFIVGQSLSSGTASTGLGSGVADLHRETKDNIIRCDALNLQECITEELLMPLVRYNRKLYPEWPDTKLKFVLELDETNADEMLSSAKDLHSMGVDIDHDDLREVAGLRPPKDQAEQGSSDVADDIPIEDIPAPGSDPSQYDEAAHFAKVAARWKGYPLDAR